MSLEILKREFASVHGVFFDLYDRLEVDHVKALETLAWIHDNRQARENPVSLDYLLDFPEATSWLDELEIAHTLDKLDWVVPMEGHQVVSPFNRVNLNRPNTVVKLEQIVARQPLAMNRREIRLCMEVFRTNPLSVTGQSFFSTVHPRPGKKGTFSNVMTPTFGPDLARPVLQVLFNLVQDVLTQFGEISILESEVIDDEKLQGNLLVIVHNKDHHSLFRELRTADKIPEGTLPGGATIGERQNSLKGAFDLWRDPRPRPGQENWIEFILKSEPGGPKPAVYVIDQDPEPVVLDENRVSNGYYAVGFTKIFAVKPFVPNTTIQARPVEGPPVVE